MNARKASRHLLALIASFTPEPAETLPDCCVASCDVSGCLMDSPSPMAKHYFKPCKKEFVKSVLNVCTLEVAFRFSQKSLMAATENVFEPSLL